MRIVFRQTGGVAGLIRGVELDSNELPPDQLRRLDQFLGSRDAEKLAAARAPGARDAMTYRLRVERPEGDVTLAFDEPNLPSGLEALIDFLQPQLRPRKPE